jgi:hypothetical protein
MPQQGVYTRQAGKKRALCFLRWDSLLSTVPLMIKGISQLHTCNTYPSTNPPQHIPWGTRAQPSTGIYAISTSESTTDLRPGPGMDLVYFWYTVWQTQVPLVAPR